MQWIVESPRILVYSGISKWLQDIYGTLIEIDGLNYMIDRIDWFDVRDMPGDSYSVIAVVEMIPASGPPLMSPKNVVELESDLDGRRN